MCALSVYVFDSEALFLFWIMETNDEQGLETWLPELGLGPCVGGMEGSAFWYRGAGGQED